MKKYKETTISSNKKCFNWSDIDTVLLDMDGTLLDLHFDNYFWLDHLPKRYSKIHGISLEEAHIYIEKLTNETKGTLNWYSTKYWSEKLLVNIVELKKEVRFLVKVRPFVFDFLEQLRVTGKKRILVTNAHPEILMLKVNDTEIDKELDAIFTSHEFNEPKESQLFWSKLAHQIAFDPKRTLFIDDSIRILEAAKKFGIKSILGINKPDSTKNVNLISGFDSISYFDEILPIIQKEECKKKIRIDKWLWAARFFKTRNLSKAAITAGKVQIDGNKVKVSKDLALGTILSIKQGMDEKIVIVKNLCGKRGSATRAQEMYTETEESICTRARNDASKKVFYNNFLKSKRPTKKERRQIHKFSKKNIYDL